MADKKISQLTSATTPLVGTEVLPIVQSGATVKATVDSLGAAVGYLPAGIGAVSTSVQAKLRESVSVFDFMTAAEIADVQSGSPSMNHTAAIQTALNSVKCTVSGLSAGGANAGDALEFPVGVYRCGQLSIDRPVYLKGLGDGQATDSSERSKIVFIGTGTFMTFTINAGYCLVEGLSLYGSKAGGVNISTGVYGNVAVEVGQGMGGTFRDVYFENFDIGFLSRTRAGDSWGGAYRYLENCKFRDNTYSSAQLGLVTDQHYIACDFRSNNSTGYVYIGTDLSPADNYQNTFFTDCMFELLGDNNFATRGLIIRGSAYVKAINCYFELAAVFVDTDAHFVSMSYHRWQNGTSERVGGGGFVDLDKTSASTKPYQMPDLGDVFWTVNNMTANGQDYVGDRLCNKYTVTNTSFPQLSSSDFTMLYKLSKQCVPASFKFMVVQVELEYYSPINVTVDMRISAGSNGGSPSTTTPTVSTWTENTYYDSVAGWKRKTYTLPFDSTVGGKPLSYLRPYFDVVGSAISDVIGIRNVSMKVICI